MYLVTIVTISGVIGFDVTPNSVRNQLKNVKEDIIVEIGSPGGFVFDGLEIFNILRDFKGGKVETRLMGLAASMAAVIALAGDKVTAHDNAVFMIHNALNLVIGNPAFLASSPKKKLSSSINCLISFKLFPDFLTKTFAKLFETASK